MTFIIIRCESRLDRNRSRFDVHLWHFWYIFSHHGARVKFFWLFFWFSAKLKKNFFSPDSDAKPFVHSCTAICTFVCIHAILGTVFRDFLSTFHFSPLYGNDFENLLTMEKRVRSFPKREVKSSRGGQMRSLNCAIFIAIEWDQWSD